MSEQMQMNRRGFLEISGSAAAVLSMTGGTGVAQQLQNPEDFDNAALLVGPFENRPDPDGEFFADKTAGHWIYWGTSDGGVTLSELTYGDDAWTLLSIGSTENPVPAVHTESLDNVRYASAFDGADGGTQIQNAVDDLPSSGGVVVVGPEGPDDVSGSSGADATRGTAAWEISSPIALPSNITLLLNACYLFLADNADDNLIKSDNVVTSPSGTVARRENINIIGTGPDTWLDGNEANQDSTLDNWKEIGVILYKVDDFSVRNLRIGPTLGFALSPQNVTQGDIENIWFDQETGNARNADGLHQVGPIDGVTGRGLYGTAADDFVALTSTTTNVKLSYAQAIGEAAGDIKNCSYEQVHGEVVTSTNPSLFNIFADDTNVVRDITMAHATLEGATAEAILDVEGITGATKANVERITLAHATAVKSDAVGVKLDSCGASDLTLDDVTVRDGFPLFNQDGNEIDGLDVIGCKQFDSGSSTNGVGGFLRLNGTASDIRVIGGEGRMGSVAGTESNGRAIAIESAATVDNLVVKGTTFHNFGQAIFIDSAATITAPVRFDGVTTKNCTTDYQLDQTLGIAINGRGQESAGAETPTATEWSVGDIVDFTDSGDGSGTGVYQLAQDGSTWTALA